MRRHLHLVVILVAAGASVGTSTPQQVMAGPHWEATATLTHAEALGVGETWAAKIRFSLRPPERGLMSGHVTISLDEIDDINDYHSLRVDNASGEQLGLLSSPPGDAARQLTLDAFDDCSLGRPCEATYRVVMTNVRGASAPRFTAVAEVTHSGGRRVNGDGQTIEASLEEIDPAPVDDDTGAPVDSGNADDTGGSSDTGDPSDTGGQ